MNPRARRYAIEHISEFDYGTSVRGSVMVTALQPRDEGRQRLRHFRLEIDPQATPVSGTDSFGNIVHLVHVHREHERILLRSRCVVEVSPDPSPQPGGTQWSAVREAAAAAGVWHFANPSRFVRPSPALRDFSERNGIVIRDDPLASLLEASSTLHRALKYAPGSTSADSTIDQALGTGCGVCQDFTHIYLALARGWGIPCRYVSGYLQQDGRPGARSPEAASHAWAECYFPGAGWIGFDPTNDAVADERYVRVAVGRDYADVAPTRGTMLGGGTQTLAVRVTIREGDSFEPYAPTTTVSYVNPPEPSETIGVNQQ